MRNVRAFRADVITADVRLLTITNSRAEAVFVVRFLRVNSAGEKNKLCAFFFIFIYTHIRIYTFFSREYFFFFPN